eukprot:TRINITY_DN2773_c0_g1_i1.p1 TRINITY_DN2773_c0_g1~~TRINITY_DN2773_c0_g1_i1.p1  ORF type:complete len:239 (-),score=43.49 TRINITY_DN2773_c0_g1_i1:4-690(-)
MGTTLAIHRTASATNFQSIEVAYLRQKYEALCRTQTGTKHQLDLKTFQSHFPMAQHDMATTIFQLFDRSHNGEVDFREFACAMSVLMKGSPEEKTEFCFSLYDNDGNGWISREEFQLIATQFFSAFRRLLTAMPTEAGPTAASRERGLVEMELQEELFQEWLSNYFDKLDTSKDGKISKQEFHDFCIEHPEMFAPLDVILKAVKQASLWDWDTSPEEGNVKPQQCTFL